MPHATKLTQQEKTRFDQLKSEGKSRRQIAHLLRRSLKSVSSYVKTPSSYGTKKRSCRKSTLAKRDLRRIVRLASNSTIGSAEIAHQLGDKVNARRIRQLLSNSKVVEHVHVATTRL